MIVIYYCDLTSSCAPRGVIYNPNTFIVQATVTMAVKYDRNTFIVQATDVSALKGNFGCTKIVHFLKVFSSIFY